MIYVYLGTKEDVLRKKAHSMISVLENKRPDAESFFMNSENVSTVYIEELAKSGGLFDPKHIVFIDNVFGEKKIEDVDIKRLLPLMQTSESIFVVLESQLLAPIKKLFTKHAEKIVEEMEVVKKKDDFNIFALGDALISRDKIKLWALYLEALKGGKKPEEIHGTLFWQAKVIAQAHGAKDAVGARLKPFVYGKSKKAEKKYSSEEVEAMPWKLMQCLHRSRLDSEELELSLERWVLGV